MSKPKKSSASTKSKVIAKTKAQVPSGAVMGFAVLSISFLLVTDAYYIWQLARL